jgi:hypothetical protein
MRAYTRAVFMALLAVTSCANTTAVKNFANESSILTADSTIINGGDAAYQAVSLYFKSPEMVNDPTYKQLLEGGPGTPEYEQAKTLAPKVAAILAMYMKVVGTLAGDTTLVQPSGVTGITGSLKTLGLSSPQVRPALDAAGKLSNLLAQGYANAKLRQVVADSDPYVHTITQFLAQFAERNATLYNAARNVSGSYWINRIKDCQTPRALAEKYRPPACDAAVALSIRMHALEENELQKQADAADAARQAFVKIGADHHAIFTSDGKFDAATLVSILQADEPTLVAAIIDLSKL